MKLCQPIYSSFVFVQIDFIQQNLQKYYYFLQTSIMQSLKKTLGKRQFKMVNRKNTTNINKKNTTWTDFANDQLQRSLDCLTNTDNCEITLAQSFYKMISQHYYLNHCENYSELEKQLLQKYGDFNKWNAKNKQKGLTDIIQILTQLYHMENSNEAKSIIQDCIFKLEQSLAQQRLKIKMQSLRDYENLAKGLTSTRQKHRKNYVKPLGKSDITIGTTLNQSQKWQEITQIQTSDQKHRKKQNASTVSQAHIYKQKMERLLRQYKEQTSIKKTKQKDYDYNAIFQASKLMIKKRSDLTDSMRGYKNPQQVPYSLRTYAEI